MLTALTVGLFWTILEVRTTVLNYTVNIVHLDIGFSQKKNRFQYLISDYIWCQFCKVDFFFLLMFYQVAQKTKRIDKELVCAAFSFVQVILFEIYCAIFYTNLHELFCQFIS